MKKIIMSILIGLLLVQPATVDAANWNIDMIFSDLRPTNLKKVQVAILDTGIYTEHELLVDNVVWQVDMTGTGTGDNVGHGTAMAGVVVQINPEAEIYDVKIADSSTFSTQFLFDGIVKAINGPDGVEGTSDDADIINLSFELNEDDAGAGLDNFITVWNQNFEIWSSNVVFVAAGGNSGDGSIDTNEIAYPASSPHVIGVGAISQNKKIWTQSSSGPHIEVVAPGDGISTSWKTGGYITESGTSLASPAVCGLISIYLGKHGHMSLGDKNSQDTNTIRGILHSTAEDLGDEGYDSLYGHGLIQYQSGISVFPIDSTTLFILSSVFFVGAIVYIKRVKIKQYIRGKR